jgi:radical SAM superfamily enzyme YgiQ (UPF0313 family)
VIWNVKALIVDALASGKGARIVTKDVIGAGPRTIAGVLESNGIETRIMTADRYLENSNQVHYDVLLVSAMTSDLHAARLVTRRWRKASESPVIIGGPIASDPVRALKKTGSDVAVTGEGELSLQELINYGLCELKDLDLSGVKGLSFHLDGEVIVNGLRPVQGRELFTRYNPSVLRIVDYPLFKAARVYVEALRGCSNYTRARIGPLGESCTFCEQCTGLDLFDRYVCPQGIPPGCGYCSVPSLYGPPKSRPEELIEEEVKGLLALGVRRIVLSAPGFLDYGRDLIVYPEPLTDPRSPEPNYDAIEKLLNHLTNLEEVSVGDASIIVENLKASLVTDESAELLGKYLSGTAVSVGMETGSEEHSKLLGRPDSPLETMIAVRRLKRSGLKPYVYFIHGLPGQTSETVDETVKSMYEVKRAGAERITLYRFQSLPMSAFQDCPSGPPSSADTLSRKMFEAAREVNDVVKKEFLGSRIRVVVAEPYDRDSSLTVAYPLKHGPVVLVEGSVGQTGDVIDVIVVSVVSERIVKAKIDARF